MRKRMLGLVFTSLACATTALAQPEQIPPPRGPILTGPEPLAAPREPWAAPHPGDGGSVVSPVPTFGEVEVPPSRLWADAEYLLWWIKEGPLGAPLLTSGTPASAGIIGNPGTGIIVGGGGGDIDYKSFSGARVTLGSWLGDSGNFGAEASGFFLQEEHVAYTATSDGSGNSPLLVRPVVNAATATETGQVVAAPGSFAGAFTFSSSSRFWGFETNGLVNLIRSGGTGLDLLAGFRYLDLSESIQVNTQSTPLPGGVGFFAGSPVLGPNALAIQDAFATRNQFYGGQIGARGRFQSGRLLCDVTGKVAFGGVHQNVRAGGSTYLLGPDGSIQGRANGGLLALPTNIGRRTSNDGAVVPEVGVRVGYQITPRLGAHLGYTLIYFDNVLRPGDQINRVVNLTQVPSSANFGTLTGPREPTPQANDSRFWAQGVNFGLSFRY